MKNVSIAIDGPSGAGKSTLARALAEKKGYLYVDTGAIYRTLGCYVRRRGVDPKDESAVMKLLPGAKVELRYGDDGLQHMFLNGEDVSEEIRLPEVSRYTSAVSAHSGVRAYLLDMQRDLARKYSVVMDGRDIGTVVLPGADVKIFLTASAEARAERRHRELQKRGTPEPLDQVLSEIVQRDWDDTHRAAAPLRQAEDAVVVDTTQLNFQESLTALLRAVGEEMR
jgi:cytidylate kinase